MRWLVDNWFIVVALIAIVIATYFYFSEFSNEPTDVQITSIKEWLKYAVVQAEKELGSGTGQLKLRMVYNMAIDKFPVLMGIVSFELFSCWVEEALIWMDKQLETNEKIRFKILKH